MSIEKLEKKLKQNPEYRALSGKVDSFEKKIKDLVPKDKLDEIVDIFIDEI